MEQDQGASGKPDRATHEQSPQAVSAVPVGIPSAGHTPLPWRLRENPRSTLDECALSISGDIFAFPDITGSQYEHQYANAAFIVRACNSHYELLEALEALLAELEWVNNQLDLMPDDYAEAQIRAAAAIDHAKSGDNQ